MTAGLRPQNTKAVVAVVERDALDKASQHFLGRRFRLMPRLTVQDVPSSVAVNNSLMVRIDRPAFRLPWGFPRADHRHPPGLRFF